jgi:hypothetical protein
MVELLLVLVVTDDVLNQVLLLLVKVVLQELFGYQV